MKFLGLALVAIAFCAAASVSWAADAPAVSREVEEFFEKDVRPLLVQHCVECHGPKVQESGLRLDSRDWMMKGVEGQSVVAPGHPERSRLISVIRYDGDVQMPPDGKLPEKEYAVLVKWVKLGAPWPAAAVPSEPVPSEPPASEPSAPAHGAIADMDARYRDARANHWSYQPIRHVSPPKVHDAAWLRTPVDAFVLSRLERAGLKPSPKADRRTLLRRVTFDLIGLPPTAAEVEAFERDKSPDAYSKAVERLLASPHYGERWARHWLDLARYADTKGYVFTEDMRYPFAYTYRDYVVRAFNDDVPYDRFVLEQLAADQLSLGEDNRPLAALGFLTVGRRFSNNQQDIIDDRIDVVTRGLLGLTVGCARCHDHKYDAIPTDDYYSLYGVMASCVEPKELPLVGKPADTPEYRKFSEELAKLEDDARKYLNELRTDLQEELREHVGDHLAQILIQRYKTTPQQEQFDFVFTKGEPRPAIVRRWNEYLNREAQRRGNIFALWHKFAALHEEEFEAGTQKILASLKSEKPDSRLATNRLVREAFLKTPPKSIEDVVMVYDRLFVDVVQKWRALEAPTKKDGSKPPEKFDDPALEQLRLVLYGPDSPAAINDADTHAIAEQKKRQELDKLRSKVTALMASSPAAPPRAMILNDAPTPNNPRVFVRGNPGRPGKPVPRQFLKVVAGDYRRPFTKGSGRLELAQAIVAAENPLTARVMVNRVWQGHFGAGLVRTPSDFGVRGDVPSHPELLDWLAATFREEGWSVKKLHRAIVLSNTYQQASHDRSDGLRIDPENRLLWRTNRRRLEFEAVRDSILAVAGTLDERLGGQPIDLNKNPSATRRTLYAMVDRQDLPGMFRVFDFADPDVSTDQRPRTTVPQQALYVMNAPLVLEQARKLAARAEGEPADKVKALYRCVLAREPRPDEVKLGLAFIEREQKELEKPKPETAKPAPVAEAKPKGKQVNKDKSPPAAPPVPPLTAWEMYAQVLVLTNEFMFVD